MRHLTRAILAGVICGLLASVWIGYSWTWDMPYTNYVYQEFSTDDHDAGFEHVVGYTGSQQFYWSELISSRSFKLSVIDSAGETAESKRGLLPSAEVMKNIPWDSGKRDSLFLVLGWTLCPEPMEELDSKVQQEAECFSNAFVRAAEARGVYVEAVGELGVHSVDRGSLRSTLRRWLPRTLFLSIVSAIIACIFITRKEPNKPSEVTPDGAPPL